MSLACTARSRATRLPSVPAHHHQSLPRSIVMAGSSTAAAYFRSQSPLDSEFATHRGASVDLCVPDVVEIVQRPVGPDDVMNLGVVEIELPFSSPGTVTIRATSAKT